MQRCCDPSSILFAVVVDVVFVNADAIISRGAGDFDACRFRGRSDDDDVEVCKHTSSSLSSSPSLSCEGGRSRISLSSAASSGADLFVFLPPALPPVPLVCVMF